MEEKLKEEGTLKQDSKKKKRRFPIILCIVLLLCAALGGLLAAGIIKVPTSGGEFVDVQTAALIKEANDVKDEQTLRELLLLDMELEITVTEDITISETFIVNGTKTLYGDKTITVDAAGTFVETYAFTMSKGSNLTIDGLNIYGKGMGLGIFVDQRATLNYKTGEISYVYRGIVVRGDVTIDDVHMYYATNSGVYIEPAYGGTAVVNGGTIEYGSSRGLSVGLRGTLTINEGVTVSNFMNTLVYSEGNLNVHGGTFKDGSSYGIQVYSGTANIEYKGSDKDGYIEIANTGGAGMYVRSDADTIISRVHVDTTGTNALFVQKIAGEKTTVNLSDCVFENTKGNTISTIKKVNIKDVSVYNSGGAALYCRATSEVTVENFKGVNSKTYGMIADGATLTGNNVTIEDTGYHSIKTVEIDGSSAKVELKNFTMKGALKNNLNIQIGSDVVLKDGVLDKSVRTNVYVEKGSTLSMDNVQVLGTTDSDVNNVTATTEAKITLNNCEVSGAGAKGLYMDKGGVITMNDTSVSNNAKGGVHVAQESTFNMNSGSIHDNTTPGGGAGAVVYGIMNFKGGSIYNNTATSGGGGINVTYDKKAGLYGVLNMTGGTIKNNTAAAGGGIHVSNSTTANLSGGQVSGNVATGNGDGILDNGYVNISGNFYMPDNDIYLNDLSRKVTIKGSTLKKHSASDPLLVTPNYQTSTGRVVVECDSESAVKSLVGNYVASGNRAYNLCQNEEDKKTMTVSYNDADMDMTGADKVYVSTFAELKKAVETTKDKRYVIICADIEMEGLITVPTGTTVYLRDDGNTRTLSRAEGYVDRFFRTYYGTGLYVVGTSYGSLVMDGETSGEIDVKKVAKYLEVRGTTEIRNVAMKANGTIEAGANGAHIKQEYGKLYVYSSTFEGAVGAAGGSTYINKGTAYFEDCIFTGNQAKYSAGALLANKGTEVTVVSTTFEDNQSGTNGGAINAMNATLNVTDSIFKNNTSSASGGAVAATELSTVTMKNTSYSASAGFEGNSASAGGALHFNNATVNISGYTFDGNTSKNQGGAINTGDSKVYLTITDSVIKNSTATKASGGAIYSKAQELTVIEVGFIGNTSYTNGGAIQFDTAGLLTATSCTFDSNKTNNENGGAVAIANGSKAVFDGEGLFTGNKTVKAGQTGGAIYMNAKAGDVSISGYTFSGNTATQGGAIRNNGAKLTITDSAFNGNTTTQQGGAMFIQEGSDVEISKTTFTGNSSSTASGGAIYANNSTLALKDTDFAQNVATTAGGAIIATNAVTLTADSCDFTNNSANNTSTEGGGALAVTNQSTLTMTGKGTISGNKAENATRGGGALYTNTSVISITGYTFDGNQAVSGGAVSIHTGSPNAGEKTVTIADSTFTNNQATSGKGGAIINGDPENEGTGSLRAVNISNCAFGTADNGNTSSGNGGAIWTGKGSVVAITGSTFTDNTSDGDGGAILNNAATLTVTADFVGNTANGTGGAGAIRALSGTIEITDSTFDDNEATAGNGGAISGAANFTIVGTEFKNNDALQNGGGMHNSSAAVTTVTDCIFDNNTAGNSDNRGGGAIFSQGSLTIEDSVIKNNTGLYNGGAMRFEGTYLSIAGSEFTNNTATNKFGGAIYTTCSATITDTTFDDNAAKVSGGAIYTTNGNLTITTGVFKNNEVTGGQGGAIFVNSGTHEITNSKFGLLGENNSVSEGNTSSNQGGALWINTGATVTIKDSVVADSRATGASGGAIYVKGILNVDNTDFVDNDAKSTAGAINCDGGGQLNANNCDFINNHANGGDSGAVGVTTGSKAAFTGKGTFSSNTATSAGGAINTNNSELSVDGYTFTNNSATEGGAINIKNGTTVGKDASALANVAIVIKNSVFEKNTATAKTGGAINNLGRILTVEGCTFGAADKGNTAKTAGGAIYTNATTTVKDSNFVANVASEDGGAIYVNKGITLTNSDFTSNSGRRGGAVYVNAVGNGVNINGGTYTYNNAVYAGGAFNQGTGTATIQNVTMQYNTAGAFDPVKTWGCGGGAMMLGGSMNLTLTNSTINNNGSTYEGNVADFHVSDIAFRDNGGSIPKLVLTDSTFDGVVAWNEETSTGDYGLVQFKTAYTGNGITFCKPSYIVEGKNLVEFSGTWTDEDKATTVAQITVRGDYTSPSEYAVGQYCVTLSADNKYGVLQQCEASITKDGETTYYATLNTAVEGAESGDTITVLKSITVASTVSVDKEVTITNKENVDVSIYRGTTSNMMNVTANGNLTIVKSASGSITIDGRTKEAATQETPATEGTSGSSLIKLDAGQLTLTGVTLQYGNYADNGGAVYIQNGGNLTASGTTFKNNKARSGGAIFVLPGSASTVDIKEGSLFLNNEAMNYGGGAIYFNKSAGVVSNLYLTNTTFQGNHSVSQDGAVQVGGSKTTFIVDSCNFIGNYSAGDGGAVGVTSSTMKAEFKGTGTFQGNYTTGSGKAGGAINTNGSAISITGYTFDGNYAPQGGAINIKNGAAADKSAVAIAKCTFTSNYTTTGVGGAIYNQGRNVNITDCKFGDYDTENSKSLGNTAKTQGGAIYHTTGTMTLTVGESTTGCVFDNNSAATGGGAIWINAGTLNITGYDFTNNKATSNQAGGAIYMNGGTVNLTGTTNSKFYKNSSTSQGGAIRMGGSSTAYITDYLFDSNTTYYEGGAIRCGGKLYTNNCNFTNNEAYKGGTNGGGAIYTTDSAVVYLLADKACEFTGNTAIGDKPNSNAIRANSKSTIYISTNYTFGTSDTKKAGATTAKIEETTKTYAEVTGK